MRIVLLCSGNYNQVALANKVASAFDLAGIVVEKKKNSGFTFKKIIDKGLERLLFFPLANAWQSLMNHYKNRYPDFPKTNLLNTKDINSKDVYEYVESLQPDLIMVSGTSIIKGKLLELNLSKGIINLHTGLSPYVKGGPNCTNWCIADNKFHLIGNTIMFLNAGIDSGNIIASSQVLFSGKENLKEIHLKVMEHAHKLYLEVVGYVQKNNNTSSVPQIEIASGKLYLTKDWTNIEKAKALLNFVKFKQEITKQDFQEKWNSVKTISLKSNAEGKPNL